MYLQTTRLREQNVLQLNSGFLVYEEKPFTLHSGGTSNWKIDAQWLYNNPPLRKVILDQLTEQVTRWTHPFYGLRPWLLGVPRGGVSWAIDLAKIVDGTFSQYDPNTLGECLAEYADKFFFILIDDVITTGASLKDSRVNHTIAVVDRRLVGKKKDDHKDTFNEKRHYSLWRIPLPYEAP